MKIGILTQPLKNNYGGLLQAYALQNVLIKLGHEVVTINRDYPDEKFISSPKSILKHIISLCSEKKANQYFKPSKAQNEIISKYTVKFIERYIKKQNNIIKTNRQLKLYIDSQDFDAFIVGSDQVWRPIYSPCIYNYFLDFVKDKHFVKIAYAASFGVDNWEYTKEETKKCAELAQKFNAISVREDSAIQLCKKYLNTKAIQVLDPTLLLDKNQYIKIAQENNTPKSQGNLLCYILDSNEQKLKLISHIEKKLRLKAFSVMPQNRINRHNILNNIRGCIYPGVNEWIQGFIDAEFVIADSFHGCVFAIIFNKPFIAIANKDRGMTRFDSLLKLFNLSERLVTDINDITEELIDQQINWTKVNQIKDLWKEQSISFLKTYLK